MTWDITAVRVVCDHCGVSEPVPGIGGRPSHWWIVAGPWQGEIRDNGKLRLSRIFCSVGCLDNAVAGLPSQADHSICQSR